MTLSIWLFFVEWMFLQMNRGNDVLLWSDTSGMAGIESVESPTCAVRLKLCWSNTCAITKIQCSYRLFCRRRRIVSHGIDGFHSIFSLGNWRALHHHASCWLVNIHITWHFRLPVSMVNYGMESVYCSLSGTSYHCSTTNSTFDSSPSHKSIQVFLLFSI